MTPQRPPSNEHDASLLADAPPRQSLATLLNLAIMLVCAGAITALWLITLQRIAFEREQAVAAAVQSNSNLAIAFEQQIFRTLKAAEQVAVFVRERYLQQGSAIDLQQLVEQQIIRETIFSIVSVVDENGRIVSSSNSQVNGSVNYADRAFFQAQRAPRADELFVSRPVFGRISRHWQIPMSLRISRPDGSFGGVIVMSVAPADLTDFYLQADLGQQGLLELTGLDGVVLSRKTGSRNDFGLDARELAWFQRHGTTVTDGFVDNGEAIDKVARIVSYRGMEGYPLMVAVGTSYADELAPALQRESSYLLMASSATVALLVFSGLLVLMLARQRAAVDALRASEALFRATFHQAAMGIAHIAPNGRILGANEKFCLMLGYSREELHARTVFELGDEKGRDEARRLLARRLSAASPALSPEIEKPYRRKDGSVLWVCEALSVVRGAHGRPDFLVAITQDITSRKALEARLSHAALHDALTGLPNRLMFMDRFSQVLESARRHAGLAGVLYIDLDGFKAVNDKHGHATGDQLLLQVARRLEGCVRAEDTVSRFGGDEFGIVLATLSQARDCEAVALKVIHALATPFELGGTAIRISASVGAAVFPIHGEDASTLLEQADTAMYAAKNAGRNQFRWNSASGSESPPA
nr:diguanylate cyclase [Thauera linaloolentis]